MPRQAFTDLPITINHRLPIRIYTDMKDLKTQSELEIVRESTSFNIEKDLWKEIRKVAIDLEMSATDLVEEALKEKLAKIKRETKEKHFTKGGGS